MMFMPKKSTKKSAPKPKKALSDDDEPVEKVTSHEEQDGEDLTKEDYEDKIVKKEADEDVYTEEGRADLEEDDEIEPWEEGFSKGAAPDKHRK
ncbi:MAG TPA: hypothetical protein VLJ21_03585 [Candidatus Binatia bacterium]|nr:hypothetical protein [Candidatus Binatia bacterium]